jgi:hypothetical protein
MYQYIVAYQRIYQYVLVCTTIYLTPMVSCLYQSVPVHTSIYQYVLVRTCTYMYLDDSIGRYLGLFGDHIVSAVLHWNFEKALSILHKVREIVLWVLFSTFEEMVGSCSPDALANRASLK